MGLEGTNTLIYHKNGITPGPPRQLEVFGISPKSGVLPRQFLKHRKWAKLHPDQLCLILVFPNSFQVIH